MNRDVKTVSLAAARLVWLPLAWVVLPTPGNFAPFVAVAVLGGAFAAGYTEAVFASLWAVLAGDLVGLHLMAGAPRYVFSPVLVFASVPFVAAAAHRLVRPPTLKRALAVAGACAAALYPLEVLVSGASGTSGCGSRLSDCALQALTPGAVLVLATAFWLSAGFGAHLLVARARARAAAREPATLEQRERSSEAAVPAPR